MENLIQIPSISYSNDDLKDKSLKVLSGLDVSDGTRSDYVSRIGMFLTYVSEHRFDRQTFLNFKRHLAQRNDLSLSTKAKYLTVAKVFLRELHKQGVVPFDSTINVKGFKQGKKHKRFGLSQEEINVLLDNMKLMELKCWNYRLRAILALLIYQGLRQCEIVRLDVSDVNLSRKTALIRGKGQDDKEQIDLHPQTAQALKIYMDCCKIRDGALFVSMSNNNRNGRITTRALRDLVTGFLKTLQICNTTHGFRHFFTTRLIELFKADLLTVQKYTRHKSVETLMVYNDNIEKTESLPTYYKGFDFKA